MRELTTEGYPRDHGDDGTEPSQGRLVPAPPLVRVVLALVSLDYTLYVWHVLTHRVAWLWRFHVVHHADLDLDASTALRFHAGELVLSVPWRVCQILLIGVSPFALTLWQGLVLLSTLFGLAHGLSRSIGSRGPYPHTPPARRSGGPRARLRGAGGTGPR